MSKCRACGAEITWVITKTGKKMPLDAKVRRFYVITNGTPIQMQGQEPHFGTCPKAEKFKKKEGNLVRIPGSKKAVFYPNPGGAKLNQKDYGTKEKPAVKDFGWANGWEKTPELVAKCRELGHKTYEKSDAPGVPHKCFINTVRCDICGYVYKYDSS